MSSFSPVLVLGSRSPRRLEILETLGIPVVVDAVDIDESVLEGEAADTYVERIARSKLGAALTATRGRYPSASAVLVADTTVTVAGRVLGKPTDDADAVFMLEQLVGRQHQVKTCYALARYDRPGEALVRTVTTEVTMRAANSNDLRRYVASGEGRDKAGSYALQGLGGFLVEAINGSFSNVVGLPACELVLDLKALGVIGDFP